MRSIVTAAPASNRRAGFTLIELMIVIVIAALLMTIGVPYLGDFVAAQRVRTVASDLASDIAYARAKAIEHSRRATISRTGAAWLNGWRIWVDLNGSGAYDAGEEVKISQGVGANETRLYICATNADFATDITFRPDGRVVHPSAVGANDGLYVVDTGRNADSVSDNKIRGIVFGAAGRASVVIVSPVPGSASAGAAPPC